jgi:16S rRNA (cytosine967-C5)-methyltransferase
VRKWRQIYLIKGHLQQAGESNHLGCTPGIILNLHQRFKRAGIKEYNYFISDLSKPDFTPSSSNYDLVICDAPCTGSGTWSRTPEQLFFFNEASITHYSELQRKIVVQVVQHLKAGGIFVYITCSLFRAENEELTA